MIHHLVTGLGNQLLAPGPDDGSAAGICLAAAFLLVFLIARSHGDWKGW